MSGRAAEPSFRRLLEGWSTQRRRGRFVLRHSLRGGSLTGPRSDKSPHLGAVDVSAHTSSPRDEESGHRRSSVASSTEEAVGAEGRLDWQRCAWVAVYSAHHIEWCARRGHCSRRMTSADSTRNPQDFARHVRRDRSRPTAR